MSDVHGSAAEIVGKGNNARGRRGDRDVVQLAKGERGGRTVGVRVLSASRKGDRDGRGSRRQSREVWEREGEGRPYLGEKRRASDGRPRRSDILASRVTATKLQICRWLRVDLWVLLGEKATKRRGKGRRASGGGAAAATRVVAVLLRVVREVVLLTLLRRPLGSSFLHHGCLCSSCQRSPDGRRQLPRSPNSLLFLSSTQLKNYETRPKSQTAQNIN